jgi:pilus assembly protein CpaB
MMRSKFILLLAVIMGLITTLLFYQYTKKLDVEKTAASKTIEVVVAKEKIAKNETISTKKLELVNMPESAVLPQSYKSMDDVNGKIATSAIEKGEQILPNRVIRQSKEKIYVSRKIQDGYRAVSIGVDINQSVSNLIEPEDLVDVVFTGAQGSQPPGDSTILLEKVKVLAVGQKMVESDQPKDKAEQYSSVTLELKPQDAVKLINSLGQGKIHLILNKRPASDR